MKSSARFCAPPGLPQAGIHCYTAEHMFMCCFPVDILLNNLNEQCINNRKRIIFHSLRMTAENVFPHI